MTVFLLFYIVDMWLTHLCGYALGNAVIPDKLTVFETPFGFNYAVLGFVAYLTFAESLKAMRFKNYTFKASRALVYADTAKILEEPRESSGK